MKIFSYQSLRILILLLILAAAAIYTQEQRLVSRGWYAPLHILSYPINANSSAPTAEYEGVRDGRKPCAYRGERTGRTGDQLDEVRLRERAFNRTERAAIKPQPETSAARPGRWLPRRSRPAENCAGG